MDKNTILKELQFKAVRSSGAGGQHVNKVASKVELYFSIPESEGLTEFEKNLLAKNLSNRISKEGVLILSNSESRSQHSNKEKIIKQFFQEIKKGLIIPKKRKLTKISSSQKRKRLQEKKKHSEKKGLRKKTNLD